MRLYGLYTAVTEDDAVRLKTLAWQYGVSMSALLRMAVDALLEREHVAGLADIRRHGGFHRSSTGRE